MAWGGAVVRVRALAWARAEAGVGCSMGLVNVGWGGVGEGNLGIRELVEFHSGCGHQRKRLLEGTFVPH